MDGVVVGVEMLTFNKLLETAPTTLEELEIWMKKHRLEDDETIGILEEKCSTLSKLFRARKMPRTAAATGMGELDDVDQFFICRNGYNMTFLPPLEVFNFSKTVSTKKNVGFVRREGGF